MSRRHPDSLIFDSIRLEGTLFVPALLEKAARGDHSEQAAAHYQLPKGLTLADEQGRAFRIAGALWKSFEAVRPRRDVDPLQATTGFSTELLRDALGYSDFSLCTAPVEIQGHHYPVTALVRGQVPVIVAPHDLDLDTPDERFAVIGSGTRRKSAYQLAQQFLNASETCSWALVTNGRQIRLLRDSDTLTRPAYLEFDLELILANDRYADFAALWRLLHSSRLGDSNGDTNESGKACVWERWKLEGEAQGERVRAGLRIGVQDALLALGSGFLEASGNEALRGRIESGGLTKDAYFQQLLRLVYRFLFLFTVEERGLLHAPDDSAEGREARTIYAKGYALRRLRDRSLRRVGFDRFTDLWAGLKIVFRGLASGEPRLALPALGGLFANAQCPDLDGSHLDNRALLTAMRHLRWSSATGALAAVDYRNMGPEELGSVYESLLELVPIIDLPVRRFGFIGLTDEGSTAGNARKTSGSYYTPDCLVQELIKSALDPVIADRLKDHPECPVESLLSITVCDLACGSGHFLLAAARRLAEKLAELRAPDGAVRPDDYRHALREVASRCLYGVDINPMAVELCRLALWLETIDPGKPLGFLDHHIRSGNSLLGTTPDLIAAGLPDEAFNSIEGDCKDTCAELKKRNKKEREGFGPLFEKEEQSIRDRLRLAATQIEAMDDSQPAALQQKEAAFTSSETNSEYRHAKFLADLWCAAFVIRKHYPVGENESSSSNPSSQVAEPIEGHLLHTQDELFGQSAPVLTAKAANKKQLGATNRAQGTPWGITTTHLRDFVQGKPLPADLQTEVEALAHQYRFFHWHLAFPQIFAQGGFDCILGNPPWDRVKFSEQDWFAERMPNIANAPTTAARKSLVEALASCAPNVWREFEAARREFEGLNSFIRVAGIFPNGSSGELNLATLFAERTTSIVGPHGQVGLVLPTTIVTDKSAQPLCRSWIEQGRLVAVYDFENRAGLFPGVHRSYKFAIITLRGVGEPGANVKAAFYLQDPAELSRPENVMSISVADIAEVNPNTLSFPVSRTAADAGLLLIFHRRSEPLLRDSLSASGGSWGYSVFFVFEMNKDSSKFITSPASSCLPLLEAKLIHQFEHRAATFEGQTPRDITNGSARESTTDELIDPRFVVRPRYWVPASDVANSFKRGGLEKDWAVVAREITNATNERTVITCIIPKVGMGHTCWTMRLSKADAGLSGLFSASLNSFAHDYAARQKVSGTHLSNFIIKQLPVLPPVTYAQPCPWGNGSDPELHNRSTLRNWLLPRILELTYTAWDLESFAADCGWPGPPFLWDENRRFLLRCELDAAFFHLYLGTEVEWRQQPEALIIAFPTPRHAVSYIMDTFPIVKRKDEAKHGRYRTKDAILEIYDALGKAVTSGVAYHTPLSPLPATLATAHPWSWRGMPMELPEETRVPLPQAYQYVVTVMIEMVMQAGGVLSWAALKTATDLLTDRAKLAKMAKPIVGEVADDWLRLKGDRFDATLRFDQLSGLCFAGRMAVTEQDDELVVELLTLEKHVYFPHVRFDARLALAAAEVQMLEQPVIIPVEERKKLAGMISH